MQANCYVNFLNSHSSPNSFKLVYMYQNPKFEMKTEKRKRTSKRQFKNKLNAMKFGIKY